MPYPCLMSVPAIPTSLTHGKIIGRLMQTVLDTEDPDALPELVGVEGSVLLQPLDGQGGVVEGVFVFDRSFTVPLVDGIIATRAGQYGVWLRTGNWRATFTLQGGVSLPPIDFEVTTDYDEVDPLNIIAGAPPLGEIIQPSQFSVLDTRLAHLEAQPYIHPPSVDPPDNPEINDLWVPL